MLFCFAAGCLQAAGFTYPTQTKEIRTGVLIAPDPFTRIYPEPQDRPDPYAFYVMDSRQDLKPSGWQISNPLASSHVTQDIYSRWMVGGTAVYQLGQQVSKDMGCYWEVPLSISAEDISQYDVLLLTGYKTLVFDRFDKEKLRKFVDNGGVLWVEMRRDGVSPTQIEPTTFFLSVFGFNSPAGMLPAMTASTALSHSLVNRPFLLLWKDISLLGRGRTNATGAYVPDNQAFIDVPGGDAAMSLFRIVERGGNPIVMAAQYGSGFVVVSAESIGEAISEPLGRAGVNGGVYKGIPQAANSEDLRFAYNIISWGSEHTTFHKGARRTGFSFAEVGAPLRPLWVFTLPPGALAPDSVPPTDRSPAILDDTVFLVDGQNVLHAFDLSPIRDRDSDGNPDEGSVDYANGEEYDELWRVDNIGTRVSGPTVAYAPRKGTLGPAVPTVFVQVASGKVYGYDASTIPPSGPDEYFTDAEEFKDEHPIPSPTYADGTLYAGDGCGTMHAHRFSGGAEWMYPLPTPPPSYTAACSPTVGYLYDPTSGATEHVAYLAQRRWGLSADGLIRAYPIRSYNEALTRSANSSQTGYDEYRTRSSNTPILNSGWALNYAVGNVLTPIPPADVLIPAGSVGRFFINQTFTSTMPAGATILADYQLDYNAPGGTFAYYRQIPIQKPSSGAPKTGITGPPALSAKDMLYFATDNGSRSIYSVKESGLAQVTGQPPLVYKWRWCMNDTPVVNFLGGVAFVPFGSPAVANDIVYFAANGGAQGCILAFKADPDLAIRLGEAINRGNPVVVRQVDSVSDNMEHKYTGVSATAINRVPANAVFTVDYERGELRFVNFRLTGSPPGQLTISNTMVIDYTPAPKFVGEVVAPTTKTIDPFNPDPLNSNWNNLFWCIRLPQGFTVTSSPMIMGDITYFGLSDGTLAAIDLSKIGESRIPIDWATLIADGRAFAYGTAGGSPIVSAVAGSHGMLAVATPDGLGVLYSPVSLIAEPDQVAEIDANGKAVWICDATTSYAGTGLVDAGTVVGTAMGAVKTPLNKPSVARRATIGGTIIADTGNNRIVHVDRAGTELWKIADFIDPGDAAGNPMLPPGSSMSLNKPTDVSMWVIIEEDDPGVSGSPVHPAYHYLIADSGNYRVLEIVAKFISATESARLDTQFGINVPANTYQYMLRWTTRTLAQGKQYRFTTARPIYTPALSYVCAISNYDANDTTPDMTGGALAQIDPTATTAPAMITSLPINDPTYPNPVHLFNPTFFNRQYISPTEWHDVVIDAVGVHVVNNNTSSGTLVTGIRTYKISDHNKPLVPSYAQYLPNGNVLVANRATSQQQFGEIFELAPDLGDPTKFVLDSSSPARQPMSVERQIF